MVQHSSHCSLHHIRCVVVLKYLSLDLEKVTVQITGSPTSNIALDAFKAVVTDQGVPSLTSERTEGSLVKLPSVRKTFTHIGYTGTSTTSNV